ncbi:DegQ family serine endoprotease [Candidatus Poribacteria bacterium]|nr:DegQ family serine endoprotease [Candidatus Poribacteria bacterium]
MFKSAPTKWTIIIIIAAVLGLTFALGFNNFVSQSAMSFASDSTRRNLKSELMSTRQTNSDISDMEYLERANRAFIKIVNQAKPAVVQIATTKKIKQRDPFEDFRDLFPWDFSPPEREREAQGLGSGVIVTSDGYILTNNHVIEGADEVIVYLPDNNREIDAKVIGRDPGTDVAVIKVDGKNLPIIPMGNSDELDVGEWVIAIGSPFGYAQTVTRGMVSAKGRSISGAGQDRWFDFIQTDAAINPGNSGGALINIHGELIGINTLIVTGSAFSQSNAGVGFAIPINLAQNVMKDLIEKGEVERGWLGVYIQDIDYDMAEKLGLKNTDGALVSQVQSDSPAEKAGFKSGDVIVEFDRKPVKNSGQLRITVASTDIGKPVDVKIIREGREKTVSVKIGKLSGEKIASASGEVSSEDVKALEGLKVSNLTPEIAERYGYEKEDGIVVTEVAPGSPAYKEGIRPGDLIKEVEKQTVTNVKDYRKIAGELKNKKSVLLLVKHHSGTTGFVLLRSK